MLITVRVLLTLIVIAAAGFVSYDMASYYLYSPWTRDARIRADIVTVAPDEELVRHCLFQERFGQPEKGNDKGKVEVQVNYSRAISSRQCRMPLASRRSTPPWKKIATPGKPSAPTATSRRLAKGLL
jgi:hypothetical protein